MPQFHYGEILTRSRDFPTAQGQTARFERFPGTGHLWDGLSVTSQDCQHWEVTDGWNYP